ncbi:MAG: Spy/CpxP family protein refolding chaperone [Candidatus Competibacteraceae bacterium]|nr:Spy/CpxP family protein refolding chaperone [Candidatus Competibacteraceae bacterium]
MKSLHQKVLAVTAIASLGLAAVAFAGPGGMGDCAMGGHGKGHGRMGGNPEQRMAMKQQFHAEQMELLAGRLNLNPAQQEPWKAFLAAQDAHHADKAQMRQAMRDRKETTAPAFFEGRVQGMEQHLASMKTMAKATGDLYATLDPTQKKAMDDFFASRPMHRMMRGQGGQPVSPAQSQ